MPLKYVSEFDMCKCALCVVQHCTSSCVTEGKHEIGAFSDFRRELAPNTSYRELEHCCTSASSHLKLLIICLHYLHGARWIKLSKLPMSCHDLNFTEQGNYSLRRPPKLIIPQIFIEQIWANVYGFMSNRICKGKQAYMTSA